MSTTFSADGQAVSQTQGSRFNGGSCSITDPTSWGGCVVDALGLVMLGVFTYFLAIAGILFNLVVVKLVFGFASVIGNSEGLLLAWGMLRDIGNMALLFGFIFIGVATILDISKYTYRKALPMLIIVAIAMNFSLFVAEAVIDTSNAFAAVMYDQVSAGSCPQLQETLKAQADGGNIRDNCLLNYGIGGSLMQATGLSTMLSLDGEKSIGNGSITVYLGLSLFALIGAFVLLAAAIMLAIRAIVLTIVMITAPLGFAAMAIPPLQNQARKWWDTLLKQSFFAPILILLLLVSLKVTEGFTAQSGGLTLAGALSQPNASSMGIILVFTLVIGFLIASLIAAKNFGAVGANFATQTAAKVVMGSSGWIGRNTAGRASGAIANRIRNSRIGGTEGGRIIAGTFDKGRKASFDIRATKLGKTTGLDLGKPQKGGLNQAQKDKDKARVAYAETLKDRKTKEDELAVKEIKANADKARKAVEDTSEKKLTAIAGERKSITESWTKRRKELDVGIEKAEATVLKNESGEEEERLRREFEAAERASQDAFARGDTDKAVSSQREAGQLKETLDNFAEKKRKDTELLTSLRNARETESDQFTRRIAAFGEAERTEKERRDKAIKEIEDKTGVETFDRSQGGRYALHLEQQQFRIPRKGTQRDKTAGNIRKRLKESKRDQDVRKIIEKLDEGKGKTEEVKEEVTKVKDDLEKDSGDDNA